MTTRNGCGIPGSTNAPYFAKVHPGSFQNLDVNFLQGLSNKVALHISEGHKFPGKQGSFNLGDAQDL